jgi:hypothetical protein
MSTATATDPLLRSELGDFNSIICFRALVNGLEEALGPKAAMIATVAAGRARGKKLALDLGLAGTSPDLGLATQLMQKALGIEGTKLCLIDKIEAIEIGFKVSCRETICSAGEPQGSDARLSFTQGAIQGALESMMGKRLRGTQIESVLRGGSHDVIQFEILG